MPEHAGTVNILLIEDDPFDANLYRVGLRGLNGIGEIRVEASLHEAITALRHGQWDLVLTDLDLIDANGMEAISTLFMKLGPDIPIVVLTSSESDRTGPEALRLGAADFVPKAEATPGHLLRTVTYALERHRMQRMLREQATTDPLTGLLNRREFLPRLATVSAIGKRENRGLVVVLLDVDRFKEINDEIGHAAGDELLRQVAARLLAMLRESDIAVRWGGDEFVLAGLVGPAGAAGLGVRLVAAMEDPFTIAGQSTPVTASIGIAVRPPDHPGGDDASAMLGDADEAMYLAKSLPGPGSRYVIRTV